MPLSTDPMTYEQAVAIRTRQVQGLPVNGMQAEQALRVIKALARERTPKPPRRKRDYSEDPRCAAKRERQAKLLSMLGPEWRQGDEIGDALGVTNATVSVDVTQLKKAGHAIESIRGKGYRLAAKKEPA